jgi:DNA-binding transcriptional LysR family regulator
MITEDSFNGIHIFLTTARSATFTEAADRLGITKSAVGKAIARLEARVGASLFYRSTRRLALSADGEAYFAVWSSALAEVKAIESNFGKMGEPTGRLRVDMPVAFGKQVILPVLLNMAASFPELQLTLTFSDRLNDITENGFDVAIRMGTVQDLPGLIARPLTAHRWVTCATPGYLEKYGTPQTPDDLAVHRAIVGYRGGSSLSWKFRTNGNPETYSPPATYLFDDADAMLAATYKGLGLCQMPICLFEQAIENNIVTPVLIDYEPSPIEVHAIWSKTDHQRPKIRFFVASLIEAFNPAQIKVSS